MADDLDIRVIRSRRRTRTVSARLVNWHTLEVRAPAHISDAELQPIIDDLARRALAKQGHTGRRGDEILEQRARALNQRLFGGKLRWQSIRFVDNQRSRFGSCTPARGTIRISRRLEHVPEFVLDYVIVHELAHLREPNHSPAFWDLVNRYRFVERAKGYLMAMQLEDDVPAGD